MPNDRLRITSSPELLQHLAARCPAEGRNQGTSINHDLARYYFLLDRALIQLRELFDIAEVAAICEACRQYRQQHGAWEPWTIPLLHRHVMDAIEEQDLDRRWTVDGRALVLKS